MVYWCNIWHWADSECFTQRFGIKIQKRSSHVPKYVNLFILIYFYKRTRPQKYRYMFSSPKQNKLYPLKLKTKNFRRFLNNLEGSKSWDIIFQLWNHYCTASNFGPNLFSWNLKSTGVPCRRQSRSTSTGPLLTLKLFSSWNIYAS